MEEKIADIIGTSKSHVVFILIILLLFCPGLVGVLIMTFLIILRSMIEDGILISIMYHCKLIAGSPLLILFCFFFIKELIHGLRVNFVLSKTLVSDDGLTIELKNPRMYKWDEIEEINGKFEGWRGRRAVIQFSDGRSIEIPIVPKGEEKVIDFLKYVCGKIAGEAKINGLAEKWMNREG